MPAIKKENAFIHCTFIFPFILDRKSKTLVTFSHTWHLFFFSLSISLSLSFSPCLTHSKSKETKDLLTVMLITAFHLPKNIERIKKGG